MGRLTMVRVALIAATVSASATAQEGELAEGAVYRCDQDGVLHYSARPIEGAKCAQISYSFVQEAPDIPLPPGWVPFAQADEGMISYYRAKDVKRSGQRVTFWVLDNYPSDKYVPNNRGVGTFRSSIQRIEVDCGERSYRAVQETYYSDSSGKGKVVGTLNIRSAPHHYATPGSMGEMMVDRVCSLDP